MRLPFVPLVTLAGAACAVGCATTRPNPRLAYCTQLHGLYYRYRPIPRSGHDGQIAQAEYAIYQCRIGRYDEGIATLTELIQRHLVTVPTPEVPTAGDGGRKPSE